MTHPFQSDVPARSAGLDVLIRAARDQPAPRVTVKVEDIRAAAAARRSWRWGAIAAVVVAGLSVWALQTRSAGHASGSMGSPSLAALAEDPTADPGWSRQTVVPVARPKPPEPPDPNMPSIQALEGATARTAPTDDGGLVALTHGRYRIQTRATATQVAVAGRVLEISAASDVFVDVGVEHSSFRVARGDAAWSDAEASGGPAQPESEPESQPESQHLATRAEAALLSGRHEEAARLLRQLVRSHPRGSAAKAGLIDLARLEKRLGRPEHAHCAYALFAKRFPTDARTPTVRRADDALGVAPHCRGLRPISD